MGAESTVRTFHIWVVVIQNSGLEVFRSKIFDSLEDGVHRAFLHLESVQAALGRVLVHLQARTAFSSFSFFKKKSSRANRVNLVYHPYRMNKDEGEITVT